MRNRDGVGSSLTNGTELLEPSIVTAAGSESDTAYGDGSWEGIGSSHGSHILEVAGQQHGVAFSAA